jgi:spermidine synthase
MNIAVAIMMLWLFWDRIHSTWLLSFALFSFLSLSVLLIYSEDLLGFMERRLYQNPVIFAETTPYQRLILTRRENRVRLYINGGLQFDSFDEYRYHEALVHPAMNLAARQQNVLILGGGDGMAVREVLRYPAVEQVTLVDLDPRMTELFSQNPLLTPLNNNALNNPKVTIINQDAWQFLEQNQAYYDVILIDLPDPHNSSLSKLYSKEFYYRLSQQLGIGGLIVTQATSPMFAHAAYWCIHNTLDATPSPFHQGQTLYTQPYHSYVPSFGLWGFVMAGHHQPNWSQLRLPSELPLQYLHADLLDSLIHFAPDIEWIETEFNTLQSHPLLHYYETESRRWFP